MDEPEEQEATRGPRGSSAAMTYEALRRDILTMVLRPGEVLDEVGLARRFGMSRSPIREAIVRLSGEGLVTVLPNRSTIVSTLDLATLPAFLDALELIQRAVTRLAALHRTEADLKAIKHFEAVFAKHFGDGNLTEMLAANYEYHMAIADSAMNKYFKSLYGRLLDEGKRLMLMNYSVEAPTADTGRGSMVEEHAEITAAIVAQDAPRAEDLGRKHAVEFRRRILKQMLESQVGTMTL